MFWGARSGPEFGLIGYSFSVFGLASRKFNLEHPVKTTINDPCNIRIENGYQKIACWELNVLEKPNVNTRWKKPLNPGECLDNF